MPHLRSRRSALAIAVLAASLPAYSQDAPIDNITIIGRAIDVADVPGSAHVLDTEALEIYNDTDIMRVLRAVPGAPRRSGTLADPAVVLVSPLATCPCSPEHARSPDPLPARHRTLPSGYR